MEKPPKRKIVGFKLKKTPGAVVQKGAPAKVTQSFQHGASRSTYKPAEIETGHPAYGKPGGGTDNEMREALAEARANKQDVTKPTSKGLVYKAGETSTVKKPDVFKTQIDVTPEIRKQNISMEPVYEKGSTGSSGGKLKPMSVTLGGSDKKGNPANKSGLGKKGRVLIRKTTSFPKR